MAALPSFDDKAALRALDAKCEDRNAPDSTRTVVQLSKLPLATQKDYLHNSAYLDLPHLIRCLLKAGLSADVRCGSWNGTALHVELASRRGSTRALKALLAGGANHALIDDESATPLLDAVDCGKSACVHLLLDAGADANAKERFGNTALMLATINKHVDCAQLLLPRSELSITTH
jgi:ankyrin repeat protein